MRNMIAMSRGAAMGLVEREERRTGSRMAAYEIVAQTVGTSAEWLRKFISEKEGKEPRITVGFNLLNLYSRVCDRVEQLERDEHELIGEIDAAMESLDLVVEGQTQENRKAEAVSEKD